MSALQQVFELVRPEKSQPIISREATRYFLVWFTALTAVLYGGGIVAMNLFADPAFRTAALVGMALCTITSFISFLLLEWAIDKPNEVFLGIAFGSIFVRLFTLCIAFAVGQFLLKLSVFGLVTGMFASYFAYLTVEIAYIHKKQLIRGQ